MSVEFYEKYAGLGYSHLLESGFQEKRLYILPLTRKIVQNICY